jgi:Ulp1 family protease
MMIFDSFKEKRIETVEYLVGFFKELSRSSGFEFKKEDIILMYGHQHIKPQNNAFDCGIYLFYFFETFFTNHEENFVKLVVKSYYQ